MLIYSLVLTTHLQCARFQTNLLISTIFLIIKICRNAFVNGTPVEGGRTSIFSPSRNPWTRGFTRCCRSGSFAALFLGSRGQAPLVGCRGPRLIESLALTLWPRTLETLDPQHCETQCTLMHEHSRMPAPGAELWGHRSGTCIKVNEQQSPCSGVHKGGAWTKLHDCHSRLYECPGLLWKRSPDWAVVLQCKSILPPPGGQRSRSGMAGPLPGACRDPSPPLATCGASRPGAWLQPLSLPSDCFPLCLLLLLQGHLLRAHPECRMLGS